MTQQQIDQYNTKGYIFPLDVFSAEEIGHYRAYFDDLLPKALAAGWNSYEITNWHKYCAGVWDLVTHSRILDYVQDLLGETLILRHSHFFAKLPGDGKRVSWHQDASYWPLSVSKVASAWLALDDADLANGAMQVIPGSHLNAQVAFEKSSEEEQNVLNQTVRNPEQYGDPPVAIELKAGRCHCTATGFCTALNQISPLAVAAGLPCAFSRRMCVPTTAGMSIRLSAAAVNQPAIGPIIRDRMGR